MRCLTNTNQLVLLLFLNNNKSLGEAEVAESEIIEIMKVQVV